MLQTLPVPPDIVAKVLSADIHYGGSRYPEVGLPLEAYTQEMATGLVADMETAFQWFLAQIK